VQNNVSIYEGIEIEDDVFLGPSMVFTNVTNPRAFIVRREEFKKTLLKRGCSIGANATIVCGVTIGEFALVGSGAVVNKDVKPYALMVGVPARQIGWVSKAGNTLKFNQNNEAADSYDNSRYKIVGEQLILEEN
jgi:UDP-2-acetamido-3-amino-2,3-dideoxy-glucuronate N-acetyltransferase